MAASALASALGNCCALARTAGGSSIFAPIRIRNGALTASINLVTGGLLGGWVFNTQCVNRTKKFLYKARANGRTINPTNAGDGGQVVHGAGEELEADDALHRSRRIRSRDGTGVEDGHARSTGMSGTTAEGKGARERIKDIGIKGRLRKACQGQADGSSVRRRSYILMEIIIDDFKCVPKETGRTLCQEIDEEHKRHIQC